MKCFILTLLGTVAIAFAAGSSRAALDRAICSTADAGSTCTAAEAVASTNAELAELYKLAPALLGSVAGTNTITASVTPALTSYQDGQLFQLKPAATNTSSVTLNLNSLGAKALTTGTGESLASGMLNSNRIYLVRYLASSDHFRLVSPGMTVSYQVFTSNGTWTKPSGLLYAVVISTGGGGGGGGADASSATASYAASGGGGAGGTCIEILASSALGSTETVTIGAAGTAGSATSGTNGGNGGDTTFGALHTAAKGNGGTGANPGASTTTSGAGGTGGTCTGGTINLSGAKGRSGRPLSGPNSFIQITGGDGAASYWSGVARGGEVTGTGSAAGDAALNYGGGGAGAATHTTTAGAAGGVGIAGIVVVQEFRE